jgi:hypothetical protein
LQYIPSVNYPREFGLVGLGDIIGVFFYAHQINSEAETLDDRELVRDFFPPPISLETKQPRNDKQTAILPLQRDVRCESVPHHYVL